MKAIVMNYISNVIGIIVFCVVLGAAFEQNYTIIQAYGVALIFGIASIGVVSDLIKCFKD
jgi:hypothetical protein